MYFYTLMINAVLNSASSIVVDKTASCEARTEVLLNCHNLGKYLHLFDARNGHLGSTIAVVPGRALCTPIGN